jgi:O-antigen/teichoic acid export membrane protein
VTRHDADDVAASAERARPGVLAGLLGHLLDPLFRHAYTLILNTGLTSALGVIYWVVAGRLYAPEDVGRNAAMISSIMFLGGVAQLNLRPVLSRFVPVAGSESGKLVLLGYASATAVALVGAVLFIVSSAAWAPTGPVAGIRAEPSAALLLVAATAIWTISALQDGVLIGLRSTVLLTIENVAFSIGKIVVVVGLAALATRPTFAIALSWAAPMLVAIVAINALIFGRLIPRHVRLRPDRDPLVTPKRLIRFAAGDYLGSLFALTYISLLPVIVISQAGPVAAAHFYIVWVITSSLQVLPAFMVTSLVVEAAGDPSTFHRQGRRMLIGMARLLVPICLLIVVFAPLILAMFGPTYEDATLLLRLLVLSVIPYGINVLYVGRARLRVTAPRIVVVQGAVAGIVLGLTVLLIPRMGIDGVGIACLVGQGIVALVLLATDLRPLLRSQGGTVGETTA